MDNTQATVRQINSKWHVAGAVGVDNVNTLLRESIVLEMSKPVCEIDFSEVTNVDTAAISLMMEWQRRAVASSNKVTFVHLPANLTSLATLYGVADFIPLSAS